MEPSCQNLLTDSTHTAVGQIVDLSLYSQPYISIPESEYLELKNQVGYWKSMHQKALLREEVLKQEIKEKDGQIRDLRNRLFGKKSEKKTSKTEKANPKSNEPKRRRGQQPGSEGHGLTDRPDLPVVDEQACFPENPVCPCCGLPYTLDGSTGPQTQIIELEVKAYTRRIVRQTGTKTCSCQGVPQTITAPMPPKLMPKSPYGISVWADILLNKFHYCQPTNRLFNQYGERGLPISAGTITGGLKKLKELFEPICNRLYLQQMTEDRFHQDESSWKVFEEIQGKIGNKWWLWVSRSESVVYFLIAPGRGADVPISYFENTRKDKIIVVCDRYSAYKSLANKMPFIILAFCWAHVRRDFLDAARKYPELEDWAFCWIEKIGALYHINNQRCASFDKALPVQWQSESFKKQHGSLIEKMNEMVQDRDAFIESHNLDGPNSTLLSNAKCKILESLKNHWDGLNVFVQHPEVPMDNNKGENAIRNPVTGRRNFYGSGSVWSAQLAAMMFSIFKTLDLWGLNCHHWLNSYLNACAVNHGKAPEELSHFLPWEMDEARLDKLSKPLDTS